MFAIRGVKCIQCTLPLPIYTLHFQCQHVREAIFFPSLSPFLWICQHAAQSVVAVLGVRQVYLLELYQLFGSYLIGSKPLLLSYHKYMLDKEISLSVLHCFVTYMAVILLSFW